MGTASGPRTLVDFAAVSIRVWRHRSPPTFRDAMDVLRVPRRSFSVPGWRLVGPIGHRPVGIDSLSEVLHRLF